MGRRGWRARARRRAVRPGPPWLGGGQECPNGARRPHAPWSPADHRRGSQNLAGLQDRGLPGPGRQLAEAAPGS
eukprot:7420213-Lingulodinium_polyedra.AAC.1